MTVYGTILIILAWMIAGGSPGPATLAISATSMQHGRRPGLTIAAGIVAGSAGWGIAAALGIGAVMLAHAWLFELVRYLGAAYLLFLALKSVKSAMHPPQIAETVKVKARNLFVKGLLLHLTNPKAILSWGSIYAIALPAGAGGDQVAALFFMLITASMVVFLGYAILFSWQPIAAGYGRLRRWFDLAFAALFGGASLKILTTRIEV
ncbi:LysE family translocator [Salaquimonas pukyongi]|uniref:LysE family translocator n=1 Tax=Salaquimonas pukyongi TaxID=2712698 RepID=UPI00096BB736|nr:LysE family transporter [Salaquimonas pukyongi]